MVAIRDAVHRGGKPPYRPLAVIRGRRTVIGQVEDPGSMVCDDAGLETPAPLLLSNRGSWFESCEEQKSLHPFARGGVRPLLKNFKTFLPSLFFAYPS